MWTSADPQLEQKLNPCSLRVPHAAQFIASEDTANSAARLAEPSMCGLSYLAISEHSSLGEAENLEAIRTEIHQRSTLCQREPLALPVHLVQLRLAMRTERSEIVAVHQRKGNLCSPGHRANPFDGFQLSSSMPPPGRDFVPGRRR